MRSKVNNSLNIGVLGLGYMGQNHARVLSSFSGVNLAGVCDIRAERREKIAKQYKIKGYSDFKELFAEEELDAVTICLPTPLHYKAAVLAIGKKIPVFIEKPITETVTQAKKLIALSKVKKIPVMVGHIERFNPVVKEIKQRIKSGELGKIFKIHTQRFSPPLPSNQDVSVTVDLATHDIDVILYLVEAKPERIFAEGQKKLHSKADSVSGFIKFKNGIVGLIEVSWLYPVKIRNLTVLGEKGMYSANYITQELFFYKQNPALFIEEDSLNHAATRADVVKIAFKTREPLQIELDEFVNSLKEGSKMPVTAEDGLESLEIAYQMEKSSIGHRLIRK